MSTPKWMVRLVGAVAAAALLAAGASEVRAEEADHQGLVRLGWAQAKGPRWAGGPVVGLGYRWARPRHFVDVSTQLELQDTEGFNYGHRSSAAWGRVLVGLPVLRLGGVSLSLAGGASVGHGVAFTRDRQGATETVHSSASGPHIELAAAAVWRGTGALRYGVELQARLPLYAVRVDPDDSEAGWAPLGAVTLVVGFGRSTPARLDGTTTRGDAYGWEIVVADLAVASAVTLLLVGEVDQTGGPEVPTFIAVTAAYAVAGPLVHHLHGRPAAAARSLRWRLGAPAVGGLTGFLVGMLFVSDGCETLCGIEAAAGGALGALGGGVVAVVFDAWRIARPVTITPARGGAVVGVSGEL